MCDMPYRQHFRGDAQVSSVSLRVDLRVNLMVESHHGSVKATVTLYMFCWNRHALGWL